MPPAGGRPLPGREAVEQLSTVGRVRAEPAAEADDGDTLISARDLDLPALLGDCGALLGQAATSAATAVGAPRRSSRWSPTRNEFAIAVRAGLTAPMLGKTLVSTT